MFKLFFGGEPAGAAGSGKMLSISGTCPREKTGGSTLAWSGRNLLALLCLLAFLGAGCRTLQPPPLPAANLKEPGWTLHEGQAVWHLEQGKREIAGDVLVAIRNDGHAFVQFSKSPFTLVTGQVSSNRWQVEFPPQNKHYAGRGQPPKRLIWLYLPRVLAGIPPPEDWAWREDSSGWRLENGVTGEWLEGYFTQ